MLVVEGLTKRFGQRVAVKDLSFRVEQGEILGIIGPNGAGKSTTIKCIAGLLRSDGGRIILGESMTAGDPAGEGGVQRDARGRIAYIPEQPLIWNDLTVWEHLKFTGMIYGIPEAEFHERAERLVARYRLSERRHELPLLFSKGMKQKVAVICALVREAQVLLVDEPFVGLDPEAIRELRAQLEEARAGGAAVVMSSHILDQVEKIADRCLVLHEGTTAGIGTVAQLRAAAGLDERASLEDVYFALTQTDAHDWTHEDASSASPDEASSR